MNKLQHKERNHLLDNVKGLLIFLVVFGHSLELYRDSHVVIESIYMFIYLFHMPVFVFISGYFSKSTVKARRNAFRSFFIPYIFFNTIWNTMVALYMGFDAFSFITPGWALWYLLSMFFWRMAINDLARVRFIMPISIVVGLFAGFFTEFDVVLSLSRTLVFFPFFLAGYYVSEDKLFAVKKNTRFPSLVLVLFTASFAVAMVKFEVIPVEFLYGSAGFESFSASGVGYALAVACRLIFYAIGFAFVYFIINLSKSKECFFSKIGRNTFPIYVLHTYFLGISFGISMLFPSVWVKLLISVLASLFTTYVLSRDHVGRYFNKFINRLNHFVLRS